MQEPQLTICRDRLPEEIDGLIHMAERQVGMSKNPIKGGDVRIVRIEPYGLLHIRDSLLGSAEPSQHATHELQRPRIVVVERYGRFELSESFRQSVLQPAKLPHRIMRH